MKVWNADSGQEAHQTRASYTSVTCLEYNTNGNLLAAGDMNSEITILEARDTLRTKRKL